jgi:plastocyanin
MTTNPTHTATVRRTGIIHAIAGALVAVVLSVLGLGLVASAADRVTISITNTLSPKTTTISVGTIVTWTNNDTQQHELRSTSGPVQFRTDPLTPGQSATFTFNTLGTYTYEDHQNSGAAAYQGTIIVAASTPGTTVPPAPGATPPVTTPPAPMTASVHLAGAQFAPGSVTVAVGATVTWVNDDGSKHTVTADNASFDSGTLNAGASFVHTFTAAGTYAYGCDFHGNMRGTITVTAASGTTPPPTTQPPANQPPATQPPVTQPPAPGAPAITNASVTIANNTFSPASVTVNVGSTVTWANNDTVTHTITADDGSFASGLVKKATGWSKTFTTAGTFTYFCEIHPEMTGTVIANAADGTAPAAVTPVPSATPVPAAATGAAAGGTTSGATGSGTNTVSAASAGAASGSISIADTGFTPASFRVAVGGTVTFTNNGKAMHTVTATDGSFDSDMIKAGGSWAHTFTTAGSFSYNCILHPAMKGTIEVGSGGSGGGSGSVGSANGAGQASAASGQIESASGSSATGTASSTESTIKDVNIDVSDNKFSPSPATVAVGATVTWKLVGAAAHTVTASDQSFNSGLLKPGETFQQTFTTLGSFTYSCLVHPGMTGTIEVVPPEEAAAAAPAGPSSGSGTQAQQAGTETATIAATDPAKSSGLMGSTLVGIAAVLMACCALLFALRAFLKVLGAPADDSSAPVTSEAFTPNAI